MKIYGDTQSGNCYKIKLILSLLNQKAQYQWVHMDILAGETQRLEFLKINPNGKIPVLELKSGQTLTESNAILNYLAHNSNFLPEDNFTRAHVLQWQFFEQYSHEPFIAVARFINKYLGLPEDKKDEYLAKQEGGHKALLVMEEQLKKTDFLVGNTVSIADISLYAYTHVAHEGGFDLSLYHHIQQWLNRISSLPHYIEMK